MRMMLRIAIPVETGNRALRDGSLPKTLESFMQQWKPEAAYFCPQEGKRTAVFVFDLPDTSQMVQAVEPFFFSLNAEVIITPVMNVQDLRAGMAKIP